jgi:hypothetical protein
VQFGFTYITIIPTYQARTRKIQLTYESGPNKEKKNFRMIRAIDASRTPSLDKIKALMVEAIKRGLHVKLEPHIDADVVLDSTTGEVYWRAYLYFDPMAALPESGSYFDVILDPLMQLIVQVKDTPIENYPECKPCFSLTLGSELEISLIGFPASWLNALNSLKAQRTLPNCSEGWISGTRSILITLFALQGGSHMLINSGDTKTRLLQILPFKPGWVWWETTYKVWIT